MKGFDKAQAAYDAMLPPEDEDNGECPDCGAELIKFEDGWVCNETCGFSIYPDYEREDRYDD